jgi:hypothetical protein
MQFFSAHNKRKCTSVGYVIFLPLAPEIRLGTGKVVWCTILTGVSGNREQSSGRNNDSRDCIIVIHDSGQKHRANTINKHHALT